MAGIDRRLEPLDNYRNNDYRARIFAAKLMPVRVLYLGYKEPGVCWLYVNRHSGKHEHTPTRTLEDFAPKVRPFTFTEVYYRVLRKHYGH